MPEVPPLGIRREAVYPTPGALRDALGPMERDLGTRICLVGGYVRDLLLGRTGHSDLDVVVEGADAEKAARWLCRWWGRRATVVAFERFGTAQVSFRRGEAPPLTVEFVKARSEAYSPESRKPTVRAGTLEEDVLRRDFTVNALLLDSQGRIHDPTGKGLDDLFEGVLRTPLEPYLTFSEDPLRMLRAARFASQLGFAPADDLLQAIRDAAPRLAIISAERIREELVKLVTSAQPSRGMRILLDTGLLQQFSPELASMAGVEQTGYHLGDVFHHTCLSLDQAAPDRLVRLGVLFHDVGKPRTSQPGPSGPTFHGHPQLGAEMAREVMVRLRFSQAETNDVSKLVSLHMRPISYRSEWADSAVRRLWHDAGPLAHTLLEVARADTLGSSFPGTAELDQLERRMESISEEHPTGLRPPLNGGELMQAFNLPSGPWLGRATRLLVEAVVEGELPGDQDQELKRLALELLQRRREQFLPRPGEPGA